MQLGESVGPAYICLCQVRVELYGCSDEWRLTVAICKLVPMNMLAHRALVAAWSNVDLDIGARTRET